MTLAKMLEKKMLEFTIEHVEDPIKREDVRTVLRLLATDALPRTLTQIQQAIGRLQLAQTDGMDIGHAEDALNVIIDSAIRLGLLKNIIF